MMTLLEKISESPVKLNAKHRAGTAAIVELKQRN